MVPAGGDVAEQSLCVMLCYAVLVWCRFREATNMTDRMAALTVLCDHDTPARAAALQVRRLLPPVDPCCCC